MPSLDCLFVLPFACLPNFPHLHHLHNLHSLHLLQNLLHHHLFQLFACLLVSQGSFLQIDEFLWLPNFPLPLHLCYAPLHYTLNYTLNLKVEYLGTSELPTHMHVQKIMILNTTRTVGYANQIYAYSFIVCGSTREPEASSPS